MVFFTLLDATAKHLVQTLPPAVAVFGRYVVAFVLSVCVVLRKGGPQLLPSRQHPSLQALRGLLLMASTLLNFIAIMYLQLAQTAAIFFTIPLWVCALSVPILGEHVGLRRWIAVASASRACSSSCGPAATAFTGPCCCRSPHPSVVRSTTS